MADINKHARIVIKQGDITLEEVDAIVNAANPGLLGGGGVDGAIHRRAGPTLLEACRAERKRLGHPLPPGEAVITPGGELAARYVIHAVGPIYGRHPDPEGCLARAHQRSLELAIAYNLRRLAFPAISTGAYGFPLHLAAPVALGAVKECLDAGGRGLEEVRFVLFTPEAFQAFEEARRHLLAG